MPEGDTATLERASAALRAVASLTDRVSARAGLELLAMIDDGNPNLQVHEHARSWDLLLVEFGKLAGDVLGLGSSAGIDDVVQLLQRERPLREELRSLLAALAERPSGLTPPGNRQVPDGVPLKLHHAYTRKQLLAAFGWEHAWKSNLQSGVMWIERLKAYLMLVTLEKDHTSFTERTRYRDYAISPTEFHWQSQATASPDRGDGLRIVDAMRGEATMWLFLRRSTEDAYGSEPFVFMGAFAPTSIGGAKPMSVTGTLADALPPQWFEIAARAR